MKRPAVLVLLLTFVALVVASLWVPCTMEYWPFLGPMEVSREWWWVFDDYLWGRAGNRRFAITLDVGALALEYVLIISTGGLLALALHIRERKRALLQPPAE